MLNKNFTVVMYHYVREIKNSKYPNIKGLEIKEFISQINYLKKHYTFISIEELYEAYYHNYILPKNPILLTFDDGYKDHYKYVLPVLSKEKVKASFYIPAKTVMENSILDVNKIHYILATTPTTKIIKDIKNILEKNKIDFNSLYKELAYPSRFDDKETMFIKRALQAYIDEPLRIKIIDRLFDTYINIPQKEFSKNLYINKKEIKELISEGMHIGSHGYEHYWWTKISKERLKKEIDLSLDFLKSFNQKEKFWSACYPYGHHNESVINILKEKSCSLAFTVEAKISSLKENPLKISRLDTNDLPKS
jgi:peptidoglycan/xylan/chitin deacetylase (PgdA/CDA1 family)